MKYNRKIHSISHIIKAFLGTIEWLFGNPHFKEELLVVNYHGTQKKFIDNFEKQILFFQKKFKLITPLELNLFYKDSLPSAEKPFLLLTFDDGIKNNLLAINILNKYNIKAFFFIIPDFINSNELDQKKSFLQNIRPIINSSIDDNIEDFTAINWEELKTITKQGHVLGSHTYSHTLINTDSLDKIKLEITESKKQIEKQIQNNHINSFCSINESSLSINKEAMLLIKKEYEYFFSTYPASNFYDKNKFLIYRCNIESHWLLGAVKYSLGKFDRKRWAKKINNFKKTIS